jgi:hypothetical protein
MAALSISKAWDETKAILARDGRLIASVALALVALPTAVTGVIDPKGMSGSAPTWVDVLVLLASLLALAGQLAVIRLALGPSTTVGAAIAHGLRRVPVYLLSALLIVLVLLILAIPFAVVMSLSGVPLEGGTIPMTRTTVLLVFLFFALVFFLAVRMLMTAPVASAEHAGPIAIIFRSWTMTADHWGRLLGFLLMFFVGAIVVLLAIGAIAGVTAELLLGPVEAMSPSALLVALVGAAANATITALFAVMLARIYAQLTGGGQAQASVPSSGT